MQVKIYHQDNDNNMLSGSKTFSGKTKRQAFRSHSFDLPKDPVSDLPWRRNSIDQYIVAQ